MEDGGHWIVGTNGEAISRASKALLAVMGGESPVFIGDEDDERTLDEYSATLCEGDPRCCRGDHISLTIHRGS